MLLHEFNMEECVRELLDRWSLSRYADTFISNGFDDVDVIRQIDESDVHAMGITCLNETWLILDTIDQLNKMFLSYMDVEEAALHPSGEHVMSFVAEKLEREGILPSGEDVLSIVAEKLQQEGIRMSPLSQQMYINMEGYKSTRREFHVLRARYAQELFLPNETIMQALRLLHKAAQGPPKPPKPKVKPVYDSETGKMVWIRDNDPRCYENVNHLYNMISQLSPQIEEEPPQFPTHGTPDRPYEDVLKFESTQSACSSPVQTRQLKKKQTFFKRVKHNLFGKSNTSLDSYLASSTKTLISDKSSECSNSKLTAKIFNKTKGKKERGKSSLAFERQRSNSAPEAVRNVNLHQIPEVYIPSGQAPPPPPFHPPHQTPGRLYTAPIKKNRRESCPGGDHCVCGPNDIYTHVFLTHSVALPTKSDSFSNTSVSSGSMSGDSAYSSKSCLNSSRPSQHHKVPTAQINHFNNSAYGYPSPKHEQLQSWRLGDDVIPLQHESVRRSLEPANARCPCCTCANQMGRHVAN